MKVIILSAGIGSKLWPYSDNMPKSTIPIANKPLISLLVDGLEKLGQTEIYIVVGYFKEDIKYALKDKKHIKFIEQKKQEGTAEAVDEAIELIGRTDDLLVIYGDVLISPQDLEFFINETRSSRLLALVEPLTYERSQDWICADINDKEQIVSIKGHAREATHRLCGVYFIGKEFLPYIEKTPAIMRSVPVGGMPPKELELAQTFQMMIEDGLEVKAFEVKNFFVDLDKPWHILEANRKYIKFLTESIDKDVVPSSSSVSKEAHIEGHVVLGENSQIGPRVVVMGNLIVGKNTIITNGTIFTGPAVVGDDCFIYNYPQIGSYTSIGNGCHIGHCAEIEGVFFDRVYVVHYSELYGVFGYSVDIGAATVCGTLRFDDLEAQHKIKGRRERPLTDADATYIGNFSRTGVNAITMPGVKVGSYSLIGPGVIVYEDIPSHTLVLAKQDVTKSSWGPERYGW
ncbi:MAG: sugar phosphate nucleotidyltransferase [Athalassotoga sp.]|uniref:sugar phosphate nucleotidyltransferase n=1 Tax=Athalassotoga sp. TaxID=2022597 RepID=UPI003D01D54A